ncbi:hypothetical protein [Mesorhizobium intechi]|uniref:hypothetical protein n=1 Tax=Mesorhizobium intechi TaxID=537601 RepID=UPI00142EDB2C|nr:hypothetical protein [Mesorhizobium intechi]
MDGLLLAIGTTAWCSPLFQWFQRDVHLVAALYCVAMAPTLLLEDTQIPKRD